MKIGFDNEKYLKIQSEHIRERIAQFDYTAPLVMLACLGVAALILGFVLKAVDKKKGIGLELPNIQE